MALAEVAAYPLALVAAAVNATHGARVCHDGGA